MFGEKGIGQSTNGESAFLSESNVLLSMCLPCMPPLPSSFLTLFTSFLSVFHNYFSPIPHTPSHISAIPDHSACRGRQGNRSTLCVSVCVRNLVHLNHWHHLETDEGTGQCDRSVMISNKCHHSVEAKELLTIVTAHL